MKITPLTFILFTISNLVLGQTLPGFKISPYSNEQQMVIENKNQNTRILINAPLGITKKSKVLIVFYALPNGNAIEHTFGKRINNNEDWHYNLQHIGAQTRFLRKNANGPKLVTVYLETREKSWPAWKANSACLYRTC